MRRYISSGVQKGISETTRAKVPLGLLMTGREREHAEGERHDEEHVELLELLLGVGHGAERGGDGGVEQEAEEEVDDEEDDLRGGEGDVHGSAGRGSDQRGAGEDDSGGEPDADLGEADGADADDLAGHHLFRADGGEQDLEDAGGLFFDDGARDVHAVEHDDHVHEEEEDVGADEGGGGVGVFAGLGRIDLTGCMRASTSVATMPWWARRSRMSTVREGGGDGCPWWRCRRWSAACRRSWGGRWRSCGGRDPEIAVETACRRARRRAMARVLGPGGEMTIDVILRVFAVLRARAGGRVASCGSVETMAMCEVDLDLRADEDAAEDEAAHEQRDQDGRDEEGLGADALEVLAPGDEPDVMHRLCLRQAIRGDVRRRPGLHASRTFSMKISSRVGSMTSKREMRVPWLMASASSGWASAAMVGRVGA